MRTLQPDPPLKKVIFLGMITDLWALWRTTGQLDTLTPFSLFVFVLKDRKVLRPLYVQL